MVKYYAIGCEMVGSGNRPFKSIPARVSIVDVNGATVLDYYVKHKTTVTDCVSGIKRALLNNGLDLATVQQKVWTLINDNECVLIYHSLHVDLDALNAFVLMHPNSLRRDFANCDLFKRLNNGQPASLQYLARHYLGKSIQEGEHNSVEDARTCMDIYREVCNEWEDLENLYKYI